MRDRDYQISLDFLNGLFDETVQEIELRACYNEQRGQGIAPIFTRDPDAILAFCAKHNRPGVGVYFGTCTRAQGAKSGNLSTVAECPALWVDIDCAKQGISGDEAIAALQFLPNPPSLIVNSGGGLHGYWLLEEPIDVSEGKGAREIVSGALRSLARIVAGDTKVTDLARIMRLPGTANSKPETLDLYEGEAYTCAIIEKTGRVYDFDALLEWTSEQRAVLHGKAVEAKPVNEADPFVAYARAAGFEPAIDIDVALAAMEHGAAGDNSIHQTQLRVSASMISRGYEDDEIVDRILLATEAAAPRDRQWNWAAEERGIRKMVATARAKGFDKKSERTQPMVAGNTALAVVHDLAEEREKREEPKAKRGNATQTVAVGEAAIGVWQERHGPIIHARGSTFVYEGGIWLEWDERLAQRLRGIIQEACAKLRIEPKTAILGAARAYFMDRPELIRDRIEFDAHGYLVADDACLDLTTYEIVPHSPEFYATRKVAATLEGSRECPALRGFIEEAFSDQSDRVAIITTVQEWFGAAVVPLNLKTRDQRKGLLVFGPSRTGKTQLSELARWLLGHEHVSGIRMSDLLDRFGREGLIGKRGWIADDAIGEGETLDAETYKVVVTGERTGAKRKGGKNWEGSFGIPVLITANNKPRVKDQSEATFNRSLILGMTNIRPAGAPEPSGYASIGEKIGKEELTGLLWWAIEGWKRLKARGSFAEPECMKQAVRDFQNDNNPIGEWIGRCVERSGLYRVARADLIASFQGYRLLEHDSDREWKPHTVTRRIREAFAGHDEPTVNGVRYLAGVKLNDEGLSAWTRWKNSRFGENIGTVTSEEEVNKVHSPEAPKSRTPKKGPLF